jgi:hypothetical protein
MAPACGRCTGLSALLCLKGKTVAEDGPELRVRKATLWGGNLTVLCSLVGTPYLPAVKGGILFLEDVNEHPYRIERQLTQLLHAGIIWANKKRSCWDRSTASSPARTTEGSSYRRWSTGCAQKRKTPVFDRACRSGMFPPR